MDMCTVPAAITTEGSPPPCLFIGNRRAAGSREVQHLEAAEARFAAPEAEIRRLTGNSCGGAFPVDARIRAKSAHSATSWFGPAVAVG